jgi:anti-sigma factor RsiW
MSDMKDMDALLVAYADGELDEATAAEVEAYIAATPAAQRTLSVYLETAALLRAAFPESRYAVRSEAMPGSLRDGPPLIPARTRPRVTRYAWAVAASLVMGVIGYEVGAVWPDLIESDRDRMLSEVAEYHAIYSRETVHLVEVPASQSDHLKAWLGKRVNGTLIIPDFKAAGLTFAGGRLVVLDGEPVAELMYTREQGLPIAFCVLAHAGKPNPVVVERRGDVNLAAWDDGSHSYIVVGDAAPAVIRELAAQARTQL